MEESFRKKFYFSTSFLIISLYLCTRKLTPSHTQKSVERQKEGALHLGMRR
jgi:hypothetical protein